MFSFEDYYKLLNSASALEYQEKTDKLTQVLGELKKEVDKSKGFRERKEQYLIFVGSFVKDLVQLEAKRRDAFRLNASTDEFKRLQMPVLAYFSPENYTTNFFCPQFANEAFRDGLGLNLCALAAAFVPGIEDALASRRYLLLKRINFYLDIVKNFEEQRISPESVQKLLCDHKTALLADELGLEFLNRTAIDRAAQATLAVNAASQADWSNTNYLYRAAMPIDDWTEQLAEKMADVEQSFVEEKANAIVDAIKRSSASQERSQGKGKNSKAKRESFDKLSLFSFPLGTERVVSVVLQKVKEAELSVEYMPIVSTTSILPPVYVLDHAADASLYLNPDYVKAYREAWNALEIRFASVLGQLHSDFFLRINLPYVEKAEPSLAEGALALTPEQEALQKELFDMKRVSLGQTLPGHYFNEITYTLVLN